MGVALPPAVPTGVITRVRRSALAARRAGKWPPGELSFSLRRTREFEQRAAAAAAGDVRAYGPVFALRLLYLPVVFALGPEANHYITVSHASNFRWRDGSMGDLIPLLGDGLLTTDGDYHRRARRIMLPAFHRERLAASRRSWSRRSERRSRGGAPGTRLDLYTWTRRLALRVAMRALFGFDPTTAAATGAWPRSSRRRSGYWGKDYVVQMLRGPGSPWRAMNRSRAALDRVIFDEIAPAASERRARAWTSCRCCSTPRTRTARGCPTRSCATR